MNSPSDGLSRENTLKTSEWKDSWKILIFDNGTYPIVTNFKIGNLRENNITLHFHIKEKKEELLGLDIIYFLSPEKESVEMFIEDLRRNYFHQINLNFSGFLQKDLFGYLNDKIVELGKSSVIKNLYQFNMDLYPIGERCFTFNLNLDKLSLRQ